MAKAEAEFIADRISTVVSAAEVKKRVTECDGGDWRAAFRLLERLAAERFGSDRHQSRELRKQFAALERLLRQALGPSAARRSLKPPRQKRGAVVESQHVDDRHPVDRDRNRVRGGQRPS